MKAFLLLAFVAVALAIGADLELRRKFSQFQQKYNRSYGTQDEFNLRFRIFQENMKSAEEQNRLNPRATFGVNQFSDLSKEEFADRYLMKVDFEKNYVAPPPKDFSKVQKSNVMGCNPDPTNYNWVDCGCTTPIYNQGQCGSCWAFSATETIESYFALGGGALTSLSIQQIVDCDTAGSDEGCNGGFPTGAYQYVESAGGLETFADYPYSSESGESGQCAFNSGETVVTVTGYNSISGETGLYSQLSSASGGPVSVCVDASTWSSYTGGVLTSCGTSVDHCVQAVGYAQYGESGAYWIVRNSWGESWGEAGFIWIAIGQDLCDIGDYATVVTASSG